MGTATQTPYFFTPKPLFGFDIGSGSLKVLQLSQEAAPRVMGYGTAQFEPGAIVDGVIQQPEVIAKAAHDLFKKGLIGDITSRRVAMAMPAYRSFTRSLQLPPLKASERSDAVLLEVEQYLPMPIDDMYLDYSIIRQDKTSAEVLAVAVPKKIVDSYLDLAAIMGLELVALETTMNASGRTFKRDAQSTVPSLIIDFGTLSSDISIFDGDIVTTGTVEGGGQDFTSAIEHTLGVSPAEAHIIKTKYGLGVSRRQAEIQEAFKPTLTKIVAEIKRLIRYHAERYSQQAPISQVVMLGGGANIPGISEYFINQLRLAVRTCDPWQYVTFKGLQAPHLVDRPMYATAIGLALTSPTEVIK